MLVARQTRIICRTDIGKWFPFTSHNYKQTVYSFSNFKRTNRILFNITVSSVSHEISSSHAKLRIGLVLTVVQSVITRTAKRMLQR